MRQTLAVRLPNWLGDTVMAMPTVRALRERGPWRDSRREAEARCDLPREVAAGWKAAVHGDIVTVRSGAFPTRGRA